MGYLINFWFILCPPHPRQQALDENMELLDGIAGFEDSVRKCQWGWGGFGDFLGGV